MFIKNTKLGIALSFVSLLLLGVMPIISNSRPLAISALNFALYLSIWQLICSIPVLLLELKFGNYGIFDVTLSKSFKQKTAIIILVTGILFGLSTFAYVLAMEKAGTVSASIAIVAYPLFAILWETLFLNRRKNKAELFFTFLLILGLYYLGTGGTWAIEGLSLWFLFALSVPLIWSVAHVIIKEVLNKTPITPAQVTFFRVFISAIILFIISVSVNGSGAVFSLMGNLVFQIFAAIMGLVYYLELLNWFYAVKHVDVSLASALTAPWPVITIILASIFLNETIESYQLITMVVVFIAVYGILFSAKKKSI